jgi:hypothetical protein
LQLPDRANLARVHLEEIGSRHLLAGEAPTCCDDVHDATPRRFHPTHPNAEQMLPAVPGVAREVRRFDAAAPQEELELRSACVNDDATIIVIDELGDEYVVLHASEKGFIRCERRNREEREDRLKEAPSRKRE